MRLSRRWQKNLYVATAVVVHGTLNVWLSRFAIPSPGLAWSLGILDDVSIPVAVLVAVRSFRDETVEQIAPARPLWRWTGRPRAGYSMAALLLLLTLISLIQLAPDLARVPGVAIDLELWLVTLVYLALAAGYLNSSIRLRRRPDLFSPLVESLANPARRIT
jgi:hypothetical protein